jgi:hypothetical protein
MPTPVKCILCPSTEVCLFFTEDGKEVKIPICLYCRLGLSKIGLMVLGDKKLRLANQNLRPV